MARENQGLQIALIVSVMLNIVLGVAFFMEYRHAEDMLKEKESAVKLENEAKDRESLVKTDNEQLKRWIGAANQPMAEIKNRFDADMDHAGAVNYPEENRTYSGMLAKVAERHNTKAQQVADTKNALEEMKSKFGTLESNKDKQIKAFMAQEEKSGKDWETANADFKKARDEVVAEKNQLASQMDRVRKEAQVSMTKAEDKWKKAQEELAAAMDLNAEKAKQIEKMNRQTMDIPAGEITWVNQRGRTVWINLGRADALERQITFSVFAGDAADLGKASPKASIEVTKITGDHMAEARVIDDKIADPVMPGDKVYSPVWAPGQQTHFALAGVMNIDGDGKNQMQTVRSLINMNGGVVDCEMDDKGNITGKMTSQTRFLILGDEPKAAAFRAYTDMVQQAKNLGVREMKLAELKHKMGYKKQTSVERFGPSGVDNARPPKTEGTQKKATGTDVFKKQKPQPKAAAKDDLGLE